MKPITLLLITAIALIYSPQSFSKTKHWLVGVGIGTANYKTATFDANDSLKVFSASYAFNEFFALQAGYIYLGEVKNRVVADNVISLTQDTVSLKAKGYTLSSVLSWQMADRLTISAKLGLAALDVSKQWSGGTLVDDVLANDTGATNTNMIMGLQLQYKMTQRIAVGINWDRYQIKDADIDGVYANVKLLF